jgi:hypothetical protein
MIRTIIYDAVGFYISPHRWNDANYAFRQNRTDWRWIGSLGWYCTEENKALFEYINTQVDLCGWHEGEFIEVDITLPH